MAFDEADRLLREHIEVGKVPVAAGEVLGIWRVLRLPKGSVDPPGLKATLAERCGGPDSIEKTGLPFMVKGLTWVWQDASDIRCNRIDFDDQAGM